MVLWVKNICKYTLFECSVEVRPGENVGIEAKVLDADGVHTVEEITHAVLHQHPLQPFPIDLPGVLLGEEGPVQQLPFHVRA